MKTTTLPLRNLMNRSPWCAFLIIALGWLALSPAARAACQQGCLTNNNTALGEDALLNNTSGSVNTAIGFQALNQNTTGTGNTATGIDALYSNTTGGGNTAAGIYALFSNTTGFNNTANGHTALYSNTTGHSNTANGVFALIINTTGEDNTATGFSALYSNTTGRNNTANGYNAMHNSTSGSFNVALGDHAGFNLTTGSNNIEIGNAGLAGDSGKIRIGKVGTQDATFIAGISGVPVAGGVGVIIGSNGKLGTVASSERFKDKIQPMDKASEAILALKPVTFHYKSELDPDSIPQFGLVAEEVEKVNPALVARDADGKVYTVRYEAVNAMLLNEFLKEHRKVEEQSNQIGKQDCKLRTLEATVAELQAALKAQAAQIQKVSDQLRAQAPAPRVLAND